MHHSSKPMDRTFVERLQKGQEPLVAGQTGRFPEGKLCDGDEGEIVIQVGSIPEKNAVLINFGPKPIAFLGMSPEQAVSVGMSLIRHAGHVVANAGESPKDEE